MFECNFHTYELYEHGKKVNSRVIAIGNDHGKITVPDTVHQHIHLLTGLTELWHGRSKSLNNNNNINNQEDLTKGVKKATDETDIKVTPSVLRDYYGIPQNETNLARDKNLQAIAAFNDYYCEECLEKFDTEYGESTPTIEVTGVDCLDATKPCDQVESDLDVQYITSIGRGTNTLFYNTNTGWILNFTEHAQNISPYPSVFSLSYGWAELRQCDIAYEQCNTLGYDSKQYVNRANTGLQKMATLGASVMVSDGDDGAQSSSPDGSDPIDPDRWCGGSEYACYPKTSSKCSEVLLTNQTLSPPKSCPWPVGASGALCNFLYLGDFYQDAVIEKALADANPTCNIQIFYDGSYGVHLYSECTCDSLAPLSHEGVVSQPYKFNSSARVFFADFPTGSPYVTSVGATLFKSNDGTTIHAEHAASIIDGAIITTGGGFSAVAPQPTWQKDAVSDWNTNAPSAAKPPKNMYDTSMRGYPDVTLNGHNYQVFYPAGKTSTTCPCQQGGVDGTSASSPAFAGIITLLNGHLLANGKTALGFLNPLLYKMSKEAPAAFKDIDYGDNKCTRNFCMLYGYNATKGWDPVAGLGSINYEAMKIYILAQKGL